MGRVINDNLDLVGNQITQVVLENLAADPGSLLNDGRMWYDTVADSFKGRANGVTVSFAVGAGLTNEDVQDIVGAMTVGGTESGITVSYDDTNGRLDFTVTDSPLLGGQNSAYHLARANHSGTQAPSTIQVSATDRILGRDTAGAGGAEEITPTALKAMLAIASGDVSGLGSLATVSNLTGNVTSVGAATTIPAGTVTNAMQANMAANSISGNNTGAPAAPMDLTVAQVKTLLAYTGSEVAFSPIGNIAAATVQAAIAELETDLTALITTQIEARIWKDPVDAATTGALPSLTYNSGAGTLTATANAALAAQDGVTLAVGDSLLVKNQASSFQNGLYTVTDLGSAGTPFILTRRADANTAVEMRDATLIVEGGTTQKGDIWTQTNNALADLTAASQTWTQTGEGNTTYVADGTTIELVGNSFRIATGAAGNGLSGGGGAALAVATGSGLEISADTVRIAAAAAGNGLTGGAGAALAVGAGTGITVNADDVTVNHAVVPYLYAVTLTGGATSEVITHGLGTRDVIVRIYLVGGTFAEEEFSVEHTSTTTITIRSSVTIPAGTYRVVVLG